MKTKIPGRSPIGNSFLTGSRRENTRVSKIPAGTRGNRDSWRDPGVIGILGRIPVKAKIRGGSPGGIYGGIFFLTGSWRENYRAGMIQAGSRRGSGFLAGSRQDPGGFFTRELRKKIREPLF